VIIPPAGRALEVSGVTTRVDAAGDELAALEAGWDELLLA
jgi:hypothetical protein